MALKTGNTVVATPGTVAFGNVAVGVNGSAEVTLQNRGISTVQISDLSPSGQAFSVAEGTTFPISLAVGASTTIKLQFAPTTSGSVGEPLMITSDLSASPVALANLTGTGTPGVSGLTCSTNLIAVSGVESCTVTLNATALSGGFQVSLTTNDAAITLPSSVMVAANATSATFTATVPTITAEQTATLTAAASGTSQSFTVDLEPSGGGTKKVQLSWSQPESSSDTIVGYNIYRALNGSSYQLLNSALNASTSYVDGGVQSGIVYNYYVESVDSSGDSSGPSNLTTVAVP